MAAPITAGRARCIRAKVDADSRAAQGIHVLPRGGAGAGTTSVAVTD